MRPTSITGLVGGAVVLGTTVLYPAILAEQGDGLASETAPWAAALAMVGLAGVVASFLRAEGPRRVVLAGCALAALVVGVLALFSIGALLLVAAILFAVAARDARPRGRSFV